MKTVVKNLFIIGLLCIGAACSPTVTLYLVNSTMVENEQDKSEKILQLSKSETPENALWEKGPATIDGFDFVPGYFYRLKLASQKANDKTTSFRLLEQLEKIPDPKFKLNGKWLLERIGDTAVSFEDKSQQPFLLIDINAMGIGGKDGCNRLNARISLLDDKNITFGPIAGTRMFCPGALVSDQFNAALNDVKKYSFNGAELILQDAEGNDLLVFSPTE